MGLAIEEIRLLSSQHQAAQLHDHTTRQLDEHTTLLASILHGQKDLRNLLHESAPMREQSRVATQFPPSLTSAVLIRARPLSCTVRCGCACHKPWRWISPHLLSNILGRLFMGYSGFPISTFQKCSEARCPARRNLQIYVDYVFPSWLLSSNFALSLMAVPHNISVSLNFKKVVPAGAEIFRLIILEDIEGLKSLFSKGLASPNVINPGEMTPLHVSRSFHILIGQNRVN